MGPYHARNRKKLALLPKVDKRCKGLIEKGLLACRGK